MDNFTVSPDHTTGISLGVTVVGAVVFIGIHLLIWIGIIFGNLLVMISVRVDKTLRRSRTNLILFSLAVTDFLTGVVGLPLHVVGRVLISPFTCSSATRALLFLPGFFFCGLSLGHLFLLAVERYLAVCRPILHRRYISLRCIKLCLLILWVVVFINGIAANVTKIFSSRGSESFDCDNFKLAEESVGQKYEIFVSCLIICFFLLLMLCYVRIYNVAIRYANRRPKEKKRDADTGKTVLSTTVTIAIIIGVCGICWLPTSFKYFCRAYCHLSTGGFFIMFSMCELVLYSNSVVNPIIYGYRMPEFRKAYREVIDRLVAKLTGQGTSRPI